jgi:hypothetical protein
MKTTLGNLDALDMDDLMNRLNHALAILQSNREIPIERARAIAACAFALIDAAYIETQLESLHLAHL